MKNFIKTILLIGLIFSINLGASKKATQVTQSKSFTHIMYASVKDGGAK